MEKDFFKDRPENIKYNKELCREDIVAICLKEMQPYAKSFKDLTIVSINRNLTSQLYHPRGQKIMGYLYPIDEYGNHKIENNSQDLVGRCTYKIDMQKNEVETKNGIQKIFFNRDKKELELKEKDYFNKSLNLFLVFQLDDFEFKIPFCPFLFFLHEEEISEFMKEISITETYLKPGKIEYKLNQKKLESKNIICFYNNKIQETKMVFDFIMANPAYIDSSNYDKVIAIQLKKIAADYIN